MAGLAYPIRFDLLAHRSAATPPVPTARDHHPEAGWQRV